MLLSSSLTMFFWLQQRRWWCLSLCCLLSGGSMGWITTDRIHFDYLNGYRLLWTFPSCLSLGLVVGHWARQTGPGASGHDQVDFWKKSSCLKWLFLPRWKIWRMFEASEPRMSGYMHGLKEVPDSRRLTAMKPLKSLNSSWARRFWKLVAPNPNSAQVPLAMVFGQPLECPQKSRGKPVMTENVVQVAPKLF